jgi:DNA-binding response OmpR family regulator
MALSDERSGRCRVLLVEDEEVIAMLMEDMLSELSCEVAEIVGELGAAVVAAKTAAVDLAFVDVNLGGTPAWPVAQALRERGIPFAFVTGYGSAAGDPAHADTPVLQKPFRWQELEAIVQRLRQ